MAKKERLLLTIAMRITRMFFGAGEWKLSPNMVDLPEVWYLVPPRFVEPEDFAGHD